MNPSLPIWQIHSQIVATLRSGNRLVLVMDVSPEFDPAAKAAADAADARVQAWETLMWNYQKALPWARPGEKWVPMRRIFSLTDALRNVNTPTHVKDHICP